jgi:DNA-binding HxlR family transcriptional regulator
MTAIKETSTNNINRKKIITKCPVTFTLFKIGGRWKPLIMYALMSGTKRYNELKKSIPAITEKMLIQHLRELEADNLISRKVMPVVPPHVEYSLTKIGAELSPIMNAMAEWGLKHNKPATVKTARQRT